MPVQVSYPGVYVEEIPSGVRTIIGVATSIGAFVDYFPTGPMNQAVQILSLASFNKQFGGSDPSGLDARSEASYAIQQFFLNGGTEAYVVRVGSSTPANSPTKASVGIGDGSNNPVFVVTARSAGAWANNVLVEIDYGTTDPATLFNLTVTEFVTANGSTSVAATESYLNLVVDSTKANDVAAVVNAGSQLIWISSETKGKLPAATGTVGAASPDLTKLAKGDACDVLLSGTKVGTLAGLPATVPSTYSALASIVQTQLRALTGLANATVSVVGTTSTRVYLAAEAGTKSPADYLTFSDAGSGLASKLGFTAAAANVQQYALGGATVQQQIGQSAGGTAAPGGDGTWDPTNDAAGVTAGILGDPDAKTGIYALADVDLFNLLCLPVTANLPDANAATIAFAAEKLCTDRRAFYLLDLPQNLPGNRDSVPAVMDWLGANATIRSRNAALYFPRIAIADPLNNYRLRPTPSSGTIAGLFATTDGARGVWKAPAGTEATLSGVQKLQYNPTDGENGVLNPLAINCLRNFPVYGTVCWGARTLYGADQMSDNYKYIPVRRLALFIEESLYRGTQWVVFEPNDEPLWAQIRLNVGAFLHGLFRQGAFQGQSPKDAYFVKCDSETTPQDQINLGIVNIVVGFAPLKPAEFVIIQLQQMAGQIET
ncbi:MAG TPA: phage tail sheath C-terminal domain-containing protein [Opitutaceae bacterium]|nr:phage tail sheath C-terminal domain-containing protein [Opitutaceae bacterium]